MRANLILSFLAAATLAVAAPAHKHHQGLEQLNSRATLPDVIDVKVKNLYPEDGVYDWTRQIYYQSNLWKGLISTWKRTDSSHFNVRIDGVSSSGDGAQQMAGLSLNSLRGASKLYAVAKPADAFRFDAVHDQGPCSFHSFSLPLSANSKPDWSVDMRPVQAAFQAKYGKRPYGNVASAQDKQGNSYVIFALGAPAIAKVSADGSSVEPWFLENGNGGQRPGYTGVTYLPDIDGIVAFGGPRPLTLFRFSDATPTAHAVTVKGSFGSLDGTEKIKTVPSQNNSGYRLLGAKAPTVYSFKSTDGWNSVTFKTFTRNEFKSNSLTSIVEGKNGGQSGVYGTGAYFGEGAHGGRTTFPAYKIDNSLLN